MTNKKIWLSILAVILVVCMSVGMLVACGKTDEDNTKTPEKKPDEKTTAFAQLMTGLSKTLNSAAASLSDLSAGAKIDIELKNGEETKNYTVQANVSLDLLEKGDTYSAAEGEECNTVLEVEILEGTTVVLGVYYYDDVQSKDDLVYEGNTIYLYENLKKGTTPNKYYFKAPYVKDVQRVKSGDTESAAVDFTEAKKGVDLSMVSSMAGLIEGFLSNVKQSKTEVSFGLDFDAVLQSDEVKKLLGESFDQNIDVYMSTLGLDYSWSQIKSLLGKLSINAHATFDSKTSALTGIDLTLGVKSGNIEVNKTDNNGKLLKVGISNNLSAKVALDYTLGGTIFTSKLVKDNDADTYVYKKDILNVGLSVDLDLGEALAISFDGLPIKINVPAGEYTLQLGVMADPFSIIEYINNADNGISFKGVRNIIDAITKIVPLFDQLDIELYERGENGARGTSHLSASLVKVYTNAAEYEEAMATPIDNDGYLTGSSSIKAFVKTDIITGIEIQSSTGLDIAGILNIVTPLIGAGEDAEVDADTAKTLALLEEIGGYLLGAYIGINDGTEGEYVEATFDTAKTAKKMIPFSNYTEFKGAFNEDYTYYTKNAEFKTGVDYYVKAQNGTKFTGTTFDKDTTYYTKEADGSFKTSLDETPQANVEYYYNLVDSYDKNTADYDAKTTYYYQYDEYTKIETTNKQDEHYVGSPVAGVDYYTYDEETDTYTAAGTITKFTRGTVYATKEIKYAEMGNEARFFNFTKQTDLEKFAEETTYYVGPEFGIKLNASLKLNDNKTDKIIEATVKGLDVIGLPATLTVGIGNLKITMYEVNPDYAIGSSYKHANDYNQTFNYTAQA